MSETPIKTHKDGHILEVTIDRPKANAIDLATSRIMGEVFRGFRDDPELRVAILTATNDKFFCPGWDLKAAADGDAVDGDYGVGGFGGLQELRGLNKPVICAVNGICCGGGLEIALSCDIILAAEHATFALPEIRSGTIADAASIKLPKRIPYHIAMEMLLTGRWLDAEEAAPQPGGEGRRPAGQGDHQVNDHQGGEQFADGECHPEHVTEGNQRQRFPAAQHLEKGEDRQHQQNGPEERFIDFFHRHFGEASVDQLLGGFHAAPQHPKQRQILQEARCDARKGQNCGDHEQHRRHNRVVEAGDQGAAELSFDPGFAADGCDEQSHLEEHGTALQIAQPGGRFRGDLRDHEPLSRKLLRIFCVDSSGELTS